MMIKIVALTAAVAMTLSITACSPRNTSMSKRSKENNTNGLNQGRIAGLENNNATINYRDGLFSASGNVHGNGNEHAIVTVKNRRIVDVVLASLDLQGNVIQNNTGTGSNNISSTERGIGGMTTIGNDNPGIAKNNPSGYAGSTDYYTVLDPLRTRLSSAIINNQTHDVNIYVVDRRLADTVSNWKLAVKRALDKSVK